MAICTLVERNEKIPSSVLLDDGGVLFSSVGSTTSPNNVEAFGYIMVQIVTLLRRVC